MTLGAVRLCALAGLGLLSVPVMQALGVGCAARPQVEPETFSKSSRVDNTAFPDARAVMLLQRTEVSFYPAPGKDRPIAEVTETKRIQVMNPAGVNIADRILLPYDDRTRYASVRGRVIHPNGSVDEMHPEAMRDVDRYQAGTPAAKLYPGKGYKLTHIQGVGVEDVVELVTLRTVRDPRWLEPLAVGGDLPFIRGEVVVNVPRGFDVDFRVTKQGRIVNSKPTQIPTHVTAVTEKPIKGMEDGVPGTRYVFVFEREPAIFPEGAAPVPQALSTQLHIQLARYTPDRGKEGRGFVSFDDVAAWYRELTGGKDQPDASTAQLAKGMARGSKADKLKSVQRYLQDEIADVPTFLHLAALPPHTPDEVVRAKIGDSKDQASLGLALLRTMDIDGFPVLVSRHGSFASLPDLPTPGPYNHVVIAVPQGGSYAFIDPSTPGLPTGRLPGALQGQKALLVRPGGAELLDLPEDSPDDNSTLLELELEQKNDGSLVGIARATLKGVDAALARAYLVDPTTAAARLQTLLLGDESGAPNLKEQIRFVEVFRVAGRATDADQELKLQLRTSVLPPASDSHPFDIVAEHAIGRPLAFLWREGRKAPVVLDHRSVQRVKLSIKLPPGKGVSTLPPSLARQSSILDVEEQWAIADGTLWLARTLRLEERIVPPERYDELQHAAQTLWARQQEPISIIDGGDRGAAYNGDPF